MKIKEQSMINFLMGFFTVPFLLFIFNTSIKLVSSPDLISEGEAVIYIVLITGMYYIFSKNEKSQIVYLEKPVFSVAKTLGVVVFVISYYIFTV